MQLAAHGHSRHMQSVGRTYPSAERFAIIFEKTLDFFEVTQNVTVTSTKKPIHWPEIYAELHRQPPTELTYTEPYT